MRKSLPKKIKSVHVLFTNNEYAVLSTAAKAAHLPFGTWVRVTLLKMIASGAALISLVGCDRALPYAEADAGTVATTDAAVTPRSDLAQAPAPDLAEPDMLCWNDDSSAFCYPIRHPQDGGIPQGCIKGSPTDCADAYGSHGCPPDYCPGVCYSASTCGCVDSAGATCFAADGTQGCPMGQCRGSH